MKEGQDVGYGKEREKPQDNSEGGCVYIYEGTNKM